MIEKRYIISDAAKMVEVESHVLRYWEDELGIVIPRNEMGHRYYTDFYIDLLKKVKELKDSGFQLKAIKLLVPSLMEGEEVSVGNNLLTKNADEKNTIRVSESDNVGESTGSSSDSGNKMMYFRQIMGDIVLEAVRKNNEEIKNVVEDNGKDVSDAVIKQVDYLLRVKEEREEERFKKMDEIIRNYQLSKKEAAVTKDKSKKRRWGK